MFSDTFEATAGTRDQLDTSGSSGDKNLQRDVERMTKTAQTEAEKAETEAEKAETEGGKDRKEARRESRKDRKEARREAWGDRREAKKEVRSLKKNRRSMTQEEQAALEEVMAEWEEGMVNDANYFAKYLDSDDVPEKVKLKIMAIMFESENNLQEDAMNYAKGAVAYPSKNFEARKGALELVIKYGGMEEAVQALSLASDPDLWSEEKRPNFLNRFTPKDATWAAEELENLGFVDEAILVYGKILGNDSISDEDKIGVMEEMSKSENRDIQFEAASWAVGGALSKSDAPFEIRLASIRAVQANLDPKIMQIFLRGALKKGQINGKQYREINGMIASLENGEDVFFAQAQKKSTNKKV